LPEVRIVGVCIYRPGYAHGRVSEMREHVEDEINSGDTPGKAAIVQRPASRAGAKRR
jgi:hypothetical protein